MRLIKAHVTPLTNYDVLAFLEDVAKEKGAARDLRMDLRAYLQATPAASQSAEAIDRFLEASRHWSVSTQEKLMIVNLKPDQPVTLSTVFEDYNTRFDGEDLERMVQDIAATLDPEEADGQTEEANDQTEEGNDQTEEGIGQRDEANGQRDD